MTTANQHDPVFKPSNRRVGVLTGDEGEGKKSSRSPLTSRAPFRRHSAAILSAVYPNVITRIVMDELRFVPRLRMYLRITRSVCLLALALNRDVW